ncbi:MAG TPA: hypothetical protein VIY26_12975 [Acidimicrobiales bacterium]
MGQLDDPANTFWQLLHAEPGSSKWSSVTPQGVADNGGIVVAPGVATDSVAVGFLPSQLLRFSPLSVSTNSGHTWSPGFFPGALTSSPNALATGPDGSLALAGTTVLHQSSTQSKWTRLVTLATLRRVAPNCGVSSLQAVAVTPAGGAVVGAACDRGHLGLFSSSDGSWQPDVAVLQGAWHSASTTVLRVQAASAQPTALVMAAQGGHRALFVLTDDGAGHWKASSPRQIPANSAVRASAVELGGAFSVLAGSKRTASVAEVNTDGSWTSLPAPPKDTLGLAWVLPGSVSFGGLSLDAFTVVNGTELHVYALTPAGIKWVLVQTLQVPLAYGSSG